MIDLRRARSALGRATDAASATGTLQAKLAQLLAHMSTTVAGRLDAALSSRMTRIISIQRGTMTFGSGATTADATVTSFDTTRYELNYLGASCSGSGGSENAPAGLHVVNSTTVRATRKTTAAGTAHVVGYELVEYD